MKRHLTALAAASASAAALLVPAASADPVHAKNAFTVQAMCGTRTLTAVTNGNGTFTPAHITGSTAVFVPTKFDLTFTFTAAGSTQTSTDHNTATKKAQVKHTMTCTIPLQSFTSPQGTMTIQGSVTGFLTPHS
jgi:hypothetical protein